MTRFDGKTVLITGATSGIGRAGARRLAEEGARLILTGRDPDRIAALRAELPGATVVADDAADPATGERLARAVDGALHGLWLNAGYADLGAVEDVTAADFDTMMAANVRGPVLQLAALAPRLADGAAVLTTSSSATYEGGALASIYAATKGAQIALVRAWASALGGRGIRANALVPGPIDTDFRHFMAADQRRSFEIDVNSRTSLGRAGSAEEAAAVAAFLLSDEASYVTGAQFAVDGGLAKT